MQFFFANEMEATNNIFQNSRMKTKTPPTTTKIIVKSIKTENKLPSADVIRNRNKQQRKKKNQPTTGWKKNFVELKDRETERSS